MQGRCLQLACHSCHLGISFMLDIRAALLDPQANVVHKTARSYLPLISLNPYQIIVITTNPHPRNGQHYNRIITSKQCTLHSFFPTSSRNHCAPLIYPISCPAQRFANPSNADCAIVAAVEFMTEAAAADAVSSAARPWSVDGAGFESVAGVEKRRLLRGSNQSERQS